jgi:hypothetical protein
MRTNEKRERKVSGMGDVRREERWRGKVSGTVV